MEETLSHMNHIIEYHHVDIHQGDHLVLRDINLEIEKGEMVYLVGQVGSGKSSFMKTLYGELPLKGKKAEILGTNLLTLKVSGHPQLRRQMGIVFQDFQLLPNRTVRENLDFVLRATDWKDKAQRNQHILDTLALVELVDKVDAHVFQLSGGEQQRVCIARAMLNNPSIIIADEPTGNLDADNGELIMAQLDEIRRQRGTTIIVSTHNNQWIDYFPGTVYLFEKNHITRTEAGN